MAKREITLNSATVEQLGEAAHLAQMSDLERVDYWWQKKAAEKFVAEHPEYQPNERSGDLIASTASCYGVTFEKAYEILKQEGSI